MVTASRDTITPTSNNTMIGPANNIWLNQSGVGVSTAPMIKAMTTT